MLMLRQEAEAPEEEQPKPKKQAPQTFDEFLKAENLEEWPYRITCENLLDLEDERQLLGTQEDIEAELRQATHVDPKLMNNLEGRLAKFEQRLHKYGSLLVEFKPTEIPSTNSGNKAFLTEFEANPLRTSQQLGPSKAEHDSRRRCVENCSFPGFRPGELMELPGQLEAPQVLNRVTKAQDFNPGFRKFWKKVFQSEASVAMLSDSFWWVFLQLYEPNRSGEQSQLFDRIADSFVALFSSVNSEIKDKVFEVYADCLAQSIVMAYMEAFPDSKRKFQDEFKQEVLTIVTEWVDGVQPVQGTWRNWNMKRLEMKGKMKSAGPAKEIAPIVDESTTKKTLDIDDFHRMVQRLGDAEPPSNATKFLSATKALGMHTRESTKTGMNPGGKGSLPVAVVPPLPSPPDAQCATPAMKEVTQSHQVGPGPEIKRILFSIQGRSPLVAHYLQMRQLKTNHDYGIKVRRTQLGKAPPQAQTYKDVINETKGRQNELSKEYQKICEITSQEIVKIEKEQRQTRRRIEDLQKELMFCKNSLEVKRLSDNIFGKNDNEMMSRPATRKKTDAVSDSECDSEQSD